MTVQQMWSLEQRDAVVVAGEGGGGYLHSQLSQSIDDLPVGESRWTLVLKPDGHVDVVARVRRPAEDEFVLDTETGFGDALEARLRRFMIRVKAEVSRRELVAAIPLDGDGDGGSLELEGRVVGWWAGTSVILGESPALPAGTVDAGVDALRAARVAAGWPAMGAEIVPGERVPAEVGLVDVAVNLRKGCYPGQELVERMDSRGAKAPRRLCQLDVEPGAQPGDAIVVDGAEVGQLTSVAGGLALGYVKRGVDHGRPVADLAALR